MPKLDADSEANKQSSRAQILKELNSKVSELQKNYEDVKERIDEIAKDFKDVITAKKSKNFRLQQTVVAQQSSSKTKFDELKKHIFSQSDEIQKMTLSMDNLQIRFAQMEANAAPFDKDVSLTKSQLTAMEKRLTNRMDQFDSIVTNRIELDNDRANEMQGKYKELDSQINVYVDANKKLQDAAKLQNSMINDIESMNKRIDEMKELIDNSSVGNASEQTNEPKEENAGKHEFDELKSMVESLQNRVNELEESKESIQNNVSEMQKKVPEEGVFDELKKQVQEVNEKIVAQTAEKLSELEARQDRAEAEEIARNNDLEERLQQI